jgi:hypothetical protein
MRFLKKLIANLLLCPLAGGLLFSQRPSYRNLAETLNEQAGVSDAKGVQEYSRHLIQLVIGNGADKGLAAGMSERLANAEMMARAGNRKLTSEADIARSFNGLMEQIGAPASMRVDGARVHRLRLGPLAPSPLSSLISLDRNGNNCYPGEAVFLLFLAITNTPPSDDRLPVGVKPEDLPRIIGTMRPSGDAHSLLSAYVSKHSHKDTNMLFNNMAQVLGF